MESVHNAADIPTGVVSCDESLRKWLHGPEILYKENVMSVAFDVGKRLKFVDEMVKGELKGKGFSRLCDAKLVRRNELYANILIALNKCYLFCNFSCKMKKQNQSFKEKSLSIEKCEEAINRWIVYE